MHVAVPPLNHTHSDIRLLAPRLSEYASVKVWALPLPLEGKTDTAFTPLAMTEYVT
jgi:hypothetical protein